MRVSLLLLGLVVGGVAACGGEDDTHFGPPDGIVRLSAPQPEGNGGSSSGSSGSSSGSSSSSSSGSSSGAAGSSSGTPSGGGDGGVAASDSGTGGSSGTEAGGGSGCAVSWATTLFPALQTEGTCGSAACHANGSGNSPTFLDGNAPGTYNIFSQYLLNGATPYIKPNDTTPTDSAIDCNLSTQTCGNLAMPSTGALSATTKAAIDTWVKCGAPNN